MALDSNRSETVQQVQSAFQVCAALAEAIREVREIPSGELYGQILGVCDLETFEGAIRLLVRSSLVTRRGQVLVWSGPEIPEAPKVVKWTDSSGNVREGEFVARHTDYAVPMNEVRYDGGRRTAMLKDDELVR